MKRIGATKGSREPTNGGWPWGEGVLEAAEEHPEEGGRPRPGSQGVPRGRFRATVERSDHVQQLNCSGAGGLIVVATTSLIVITRVVQCLGVHNDVLEIDTLHLDRQMGLQLLGILPAESTKVFPVRRRLARPARWSKLDRMTHVGSHDMHDVGDGVEVSAVRVERMMRRQPGGRVGRLPVAQRRGRRGGR